MSLSTSRTSPPQLLLSPSVSSLGWADEILAATAGSRAAHARASRLPNNEMRPLTSVGDAGGYAPASASVGPRNREGGEWGTQWQGEREREQRRAQLKVSTDQRSASQPSLTPLVIASSPSNPVPHHPYPYLPPPATTAALTTHHSSANLQTNQPASQSQGSYRAAPFPSVADAVRIRGHGHGHVYDGSTGSAADGSFASSTPSQMSKKRGFLGKVKGAFGSVGRFGRRERSSSGLSAADSMRS
ncbi:hypothetical protein OF83DRAFT_260007 [Amylostereum chailletii]|nr:hypothetical protein OF83DRAFT_260007 [Amylostereum chailletii]